MNLYNLLVSPSQANKYGFDVLLQALRKGGKLEMIQEIRSSLVTTQTGKR